MHSHDQLCETVHTEFLKRWPLELVRNMKIEEYSSLRNTDSFTAWLEHRSKDIGIISGSYALMFELFAHSPGKPLPSKKNLAGDEKYTWYQRHGKTSDTAFRSIKTKILQIIEMAIRNDLEGIEHLENFTPKVRWKIAFMYAPLGSMVSIFVPERLKSIGRELGLTFSSTANLHRQLAAMKPSGQSIYSFSLGLWHRQSPLFGTLHRKYYIIGTKYGAHANESRATAMREKNVISTDFGPRNISLEAFYMGGDEGGLRQFLEENDCPELNKALPALFTFLNIKVGDLVALKDSGQPKGGKAYLKIIGYAVVVERDGRVYQFDQSLGHCLHVEYLASGLDLELEQGGYGKTASPVEKAEAYDRIFGRWAHPDDVQITAAIEQENEKQDRRRLRRRGVLEVMPKGGSRAGSRPAVINPLHQVIQSEMLVFLKQQYPDAAIYAEENFIDISIRRNDSDIVELYEIKPYYSARDCIRAALGQLLDYAHREEHTGELKLIVVGPMPATDADRVYLSFIQGHLSLHFEYRSWRADFIL